MTQTIELVGFIPHSGDDGRRSCFLVDTGVLLIEGFETPGDWPASTLLTPLASGVSVASTDVRHQGDTAIKISATGVASGEQVAVDKIYTTPVDISGFKLLLIQVQGPRVQDLTSGIPEFKVRIEDSSSNSFVYTVPQILHGYHDLRIDLTEGWLTVNLSEIKKLTLSLTGFVSGAMEWRVDNARIANVIDLAVCTALLMGAVPPTFPETLFEDFETPGPWVLIERPLGGDPTGTTGRTANTAHTEGTKSIKVKSDIAVGDFGIENDHSSTPLNLHGANRLLIDSRNEDASDNCVWVELEDGSGRFLSTARVDVGSTSFVELPFDIEMTENHVDLKDIQKVRVMFHNQVPATGPPWEISVDNLRYTTERKYEGGWFYT